MMQTLEEFIDEWNATHSYFKFCSGWCFDAQTKCEDMLLNDNIPEVSHYRKLEQAKLCY